MVTGGPVLLQSLGNGVLWDSQGNALSNHQVFVYQRGTTTQVTVYQDSGLSIPLSQPLLTGTNGANPGGIPGYVAGGQEIDFYDATVNQRQPAEPLYATAVAPTASPTFTGTVTLPAQQVAVATATAAYTVAATDFLRTVDATSAPFAVSLPAATGSGRLLAWRPINTNANVVTITPNGTDTIDGAANTTVGSVTSVAVWQMLEIVDAASGAWRSI